METRRLGSTPLVVSRIGLGLAALGRPGYINLGHADDLQRQYDVARMRVQAHEVLDAAWAAGVRYFDAARSYGRAEEFLGSWLATRQIAPEAVTIGSKWGYTYTAGWSVEADQHEVKEHSLAVLARQLDESRGALGAQLDVYQIHSATLESGVLENATVLRALARLKETGMQIGLTLSGPRQARTLAVALETTVDGRRLFDVVQATWNLLEPSAGAALRAAHAAGLGVIIKEALANGRLTMRNTDPAFAPQRRLLVEVTAGLGATPDALALAAVLVQPWVDTVLSGAATVEQLRSNVAAQQLQWDDAIAKRLEPLAEGPEEYWATRGHMPWN